MSESYLIAHLVRGQPAFDIAEQIEIGDEIGWIIPTSGHRAYPLHNEIAGYAAIPLSELEFTGPGWMVETDWFPWVQKVLTDKVLDHYSANDKGRMKELEEDRLLAIDAAKPGTGLITNLAERLGLIERPRITRR